MGKLPRQDKRVRALFNTIQKIKDDYEFEEAGEAPALTDGGDTAFHDEDCFEEDEPPKHPVSTLERKNAGSLSTKESKSEIQPESAATECLKGLGYDVSMTPEQEAELHAVIKEITALETASSLPQVSQ